MNVGEGTPDREAIDVFDRVRRACRDVAATAHAVRVNASAVPAYAASLDPTTIAHPLLDATVHYVGSPERTLAYFVTLDAVNFGSGYFPHLAKRPGMSGYFTVAAALTDRFRRRRELTAAELAGVKPAECARLFGQDPDNSIAAELMALFAHAWNDLGRDLLARFSGSFVRLVETADGSAASLVALLDAQPFFRDVAVHRGRAVPFYKRAQILASDLALAFGNDGWGRFVDIDRLTIFADNLVPHVLRLDGVLEFDPDLVRRIEREELLVSGSEEEVEIRACAVHAAELLVGELRRSGHRVTSRDLDIALWTRGQGPAYKAGGRRHRARCVFY